MTPRVLAWLARCVLIPLIETIENMGREISMKRKMVNV